MAAVAIVCTGGAPVDPSVRATLPANAYVVAADSGLAVANELGLTVDLVVGDFDSVAADALEDAISVGVQVERHSADKDATDFELALEAAARTGATSIVVVGGGGGRLDHFLANLMLLATPALGHVAIEAYVDGATVSILRAGGTVSVEGAPGSFVSLVPAGGDARGITTTGLRWALADEDLPFATTRGISNELVEPTATVSLRAGTLLVIQPDSGTGASS